MVVIKSDVDETRQCRCLYGKTSESLLGLNGNLLKLDGNSAVVRTELKVEKISEKLKNWFTQPFENFVSEVKKQKGGFKDLSQQMEWQGFFKENQTKAVSVQDKINTTNAEIDDMVFGLYDLTAQEIATVRGSS